MLPIYFAHPFGKHAFTQVNSIYFVKKLMSPAEGLKSNQSCVYSMIRVLGVFFNGESEGDKHSTPTTIEACQC